MRALAVVCCVKCATYGDVPTRRGSVKICTAQAARDRPRAPSLPSEHARPAGKEGGDANSPAALVESAAFSWWRVCPGTVKMRRSRCAQPPPGSSTAARTEAAGPLLAAGLAVPLHTEICRLLTGTRRQGACSRLLHFGACPTQPGHAEHKKQEPPLTIRPHGHALRASSAHRTIDTARRCADF